MTNTEQYNGWTNRETWAFMLHIGNDQSMQQDSWNVAGESLAFIPEQSDSHVGEAVVRHWRELLSGVPNSSVQVLPKNMEMFRDEVGSWWRLDLAEIGASLREDLESQA